MAITEQCVCFGAALPACPWRDDEPATLRAEHGFVRALYTLRAPELWRVTQPASGPPSTGHIRLDERDERTRGDWVLLRREDPPLGGLLRVHAKTGAYAELPGVRAHAAALFDDGRVACLSKGHAYVSDARGVCAWGSGATRITHTPEWSPDARRLAVTCADGTIRVLSRATIGLEWTFEGSRGPALFSADGRTLWSIDPDEGLFGWDLATGVEAVHDRSVRVHARSLIASPDGRALLDPSSAMLFPLDPRAPPHDAASALLGVVLRAWFADDLGVEACVQRGDEIHVLRLSRDGLAAESSQTIVPRGRMRSARQAQAIAEAVRVGDAWLVFSANLAVTLRAPDGCSSAGAAIARVEDRERGEVIWERTLDEGVARDEAHLTVAPDERALAFLNARNELVVYELPDATIPRRAPVTSHGA